MTPGREIDLDAGQRLAVEKLRELPTVAADAEFRERLKRQFMDGTIPATSQPEEVSTWFPRPVVISIALSAAAVIFLLFVSVANRGPSWQLEQAGIGAQLIVDGERVDISALDAAQSSLHGGARLSVEGSCDINLSCGAQLRLQLPPGTEITLPSDPKRWFGRRLHTEISKGKLRIVTGETFAGASLHVRTPDADLEVLGTTLAVILVPHGTCVCVIDGMVEVQTESTPAELVPEGMRKTFYSDGRPPLLDSVLPDERMKLEQLQTL